VQPERRTKPPTRHTMSRNRQDWCFMIERIVYREIKASRGRFTKRKMRGITSPRFLLIDDVHDTSTFCSQFVNYLFTILELMDDRH